MIPNQMQRFLQEHLPARTIENRLIKIGSQRYLEFTALDVERLARLGIGVDNLGPNLVVCMWDEDSPLETGGYLVVDNLSMGKPSMGGIRMLPDITPATIYNLARGMTLKNAAANLPYGGGKSGIVAPTKTSSEEHTEIVRGFARLLRRYTNIYLPGPDVGTNDQDMKLVALENGLDNALSKPADMGGNRIDELGAAAGGTIIALQALLSEMPRLRVLPQFASLEIPSPGELTVLIQGFGAVGAHAARILGERLPEAKVIGISDRFGYLFDEDGLPSEKLFEMWKTYSLVTRRFFETTFQSSSPSDVTLKYSTNPNDLLREFGFCLIPAAPIANYLDTEPSSHPSMTTDRMGNWQVVIEGANTYSPDPNRKSARARMEREVYRQRGTLIATDYLVNSGGVIFAAQEHLIKTPTHLRIPDEMLGKEPAVSNWLEKNAKEFSILAKQRLVAAQEYRESVITRNMKELVDLLISDADILPGEAAEIISIRRIAKRESHRTAADIMAPMPTISAESTIQQAAMKIIETGSSILAVVENNSTENNSTLVGVITEWDITKATAQCHPNDIPVQKMMTNRVITAKPKDSLLEIIRLLEHHEISAVPVVDGTKVVGMISADLLARRSLLRLLQTQLQ